MPRSNPELAAAMGMRMSARRRELGLTQEMVADLAGISHQQYKKAENGKTCFSVDSLRKIAAALQVSSNYLLTGRSGAGKYPEVVSLLDELTDHQIKMVQKMLQCMVMFHEEIEK